MRPTWLRLRKGHLLTRGRWGALYSRYAPGGSLGDSRLWGRWVVLANALRGQKYTQFQNLHIGKGSSKENLKFAVKCSKVDAHL